MWDRGLVVFNALLLALPTRLYVFGLAILPACRAERFLPAWWLWPGVRPSREVMRSWSVRAF